MTSSNTKLKIKISIAQIGVIRFWVGVAAGLICSLCICLYFNWSREILRFMTGAFADLLHLSDKEEMFYNHFYAALSSVLGLCLMLWIWMGNASLKFGRRRHLVHLSNSYTLLIFWIAILAVARFGSITALFPYGQAGFDNELDLSSDYWLLFILIPVVVFGHAWMGLRLVYRTGWWMRKTGLASMLFTLLLAQTAITSNKIVNESYAQRFKKDWAYIDREVSEAQSLYGLEYLESHRKSKGIED
ncbi:MAG: hypothetical protein ACI8ZN_002198 [Bacteroidia bacterium]